MEKLYYILFVVLYGSVQALKNISKDRVVGGQTYNIDKVPYQVSIHFKNIFAGGGSLISTKFVLTAANCIISTKPGDYKVRIGSHFRNKGGLVIQVKGVSSHKGFNAIKHDIALLLLEKEVVQSKNIKIIELNTAAVPTGTYVLFSGWGKTTINDEAESFNLKGAYLKVMDQKLCARGLAPHFKLSENQICATEKGKDVCMGDSGNPLVHNLKLVGIASHEFYCNHGFPGVFTRVSKYQSWIRDNMNHLLKSK